MKRIFLAACVLASTLAHADGAASGSGTDDFSPAYAACMKQAGPPGFYDQTPQARCDAAEVRVQKKRINAAYDRLSKLWAADPEQIARLNGAQKAWVQWRDQTYALLREGGGSNGQVAYMVSSGFLLHALSEQAQLLEGMLVANGGT